MFAKRTGAATTPEEYISTIPEPRRSDIQAIHSAIRAAVPHLTPHLGGGMIGYGRYHYKYASGREGDTAVIGLASNKQYISVYVMGTVEGGYVAESAKDKFPKASIGKSCIRFKRAADIDLAALRDVVQAGARALGQ